jgi:multidrug transporter EmrE-like cation transporter
MYIESFVPKLSTSKVNMIAKPDKFLLGSIILETCSTALLQKTVNNKLWFIPVYGGYALSLNIFPKCLDKYSLSSAYSIWCIGGIIFTTTLDRIFFKELITLRKFLSLLVMILGILIST